MNIRKRLEKLSEYGIFDKEKQKAGKDFPRAKTYANPDEFFTEDHFPDGVYLKQQNYPSEYIHGWTKLNSLFSHSPADLQLIAPSEDTPCSWSDLIFLDLETTGLSTGPGTYAFLIGTGFIHNDEFITRQYLMTDPAAEPDMLQIIRNFLQQFSHIVTFNGKRFDISLLDQKCILHRLGELNFFCGHYDLLYPARNLWKNVLDSCSLSSLEQNSLQVIRNNDIAGSEVPARYFMYLEDRNFDHLSPIVKHNSLDLLSSLALMIRIIIMATDPTKTNCAQENLALARLAASAKAYSLAEMQFGSAVDNADSPQTYTEAAKHASLWHKRQKHWAKACTLWSGMIETYETSKWGELAGIFPYVELAKYFEHQRHDFERALHYTNRAISIVRKLIHLDLAKEKIARELEHRRNRLRRKSNQA